MKLIKKNLIYCTFILLQHAAFSQETKFEKVLDGTESGIKDINNIVQDKKGYIWICSTNGLYRYDGLVFKHYSNNTITKDSPGIDSLICLAIDSAGIIWIGTNSSGLEKYDPSINSFSYFQHRPDDLSTLTDNHIVCITVDHLNNIWIGTSNGLDKLNKTDQKFIHYKNEKNNSSSLGGNKINAIYEDNEGVVWVGCNSSTDNSIKIGGLNRLNVSTGKFTHYFNNPNDSNTLINNYVTAISEDNKKNLWVGTANDGIQILNTSTGKFTRYTYDLRHPENLHTSPASIVSPILRDHPAFIDEDKKGMVWVGSNLHGISCYDPQSKKGMHFGNILLRDNPSYFLEDSISGFKENDATAFFCSKDGTIWIGTYEGNLFKLIKQPANIPYYNIKAGANSFYEENDSILWIATSIKGLDRRNIITGKDNWITNKNGDATIPPDHDILGLRADTYSNLWIATYTGLYKLNLKKNIFKRYLHDEQNLNTPSTDSFRCMHMDKKDLWLGTNEHGIDKLNLENGSITHYFHNDKDSNTIINNAINCIKEDKDNNIWAATLEGLDKLDPKNNKISHYLIHSEILSICNDAAGKIWAGTTKGFYYFDTKENKFKEYFNQNSPAKIKNVLDIQEDNEHNLWLTTDNGITRINDHNNTVNIYGKAYGYHYNNYYDCDNYKLKDGQILIGDQNGYYIVSPADFKSARNFFLNLTNFKINDEEVLDTGVNNALWQTKEIRLNYKQSTFSFDFCSTDYSNTNEIKYLFKLENHNATWHDIGTNHQAYFFNVQPGSYIFHVKAISPDGFWCEKSISVIISPPWWRTWWAYTLYIILFAISIWSFIAYRSRALRNQNKILEDKVTGRTQELKKSIEELKSTQSQLIQSEKMASLGELTAGIAHEIQNPLNFVNNFSEVSNELLDEMNEEIAKGNLEEAKAIAEDVKQNLEKINHHGKRADAIVKGMLQHSRTTNSTKEPTDINKLADEYLRLAYHGLRAKDKSFNTTLKTDFDETIGKINIIPQDIGRVVLNLLTNAFYSVNEKSRMNMEGYEPCVTVSTKKMGAKVQIKVWDNGNGIPQKVLDKIFQPFFTTKPTGQGTGLGLSLSYDIITKGHGGELKIETNEGEFAEFTITL